MGSEKTKGVKMITLTKDYSDISNAYRYKITTIKKDGLKRIEWVDMQDVYIKLIGIESCKEEKVLSKHNDFTYDIQYVITCRQMFMYVQGRNEKEDNKIAIIKRSLQHIPFLNSVEVSKIDKSIHFNNFDRIYVHNGAFYIVKHHDFQPYVP